MRLLVIGTILTMSFNCFAAEAFFTGRMKFVTTVTYETGIKCQYNYLGRTFWKTYVNASNCPAQVQVR